MGYLVLYCKLMEMVIILLLLALTYKHDRRICV
jgi:hypothetical protein